MAIKKPWEPPIGFLVQKKFGYPNGLGDTWLGISHLGHEDPYAGIYQRNHKNGHQICTRSRFYQQWKPRTPNQIAAAQKFAAGMAEWKNLTDEEKKQYNERAKKYRIEGVNLFMREYMLSN
ncbi:MAG: hypothetical protein J7J61_07450 [Candidatus Hydrothermae bacterium]|nr:hypothetical protein [Candidatus Hydrothermae bacterium]